MKSIRTSIGALKIGAVASSKSLSGIDKSRELFSRSIIMSIRALCPLLSLKNITQKSNRVIA